MASPPGGMVGTRTPALEVRGVRTHHFSSNIFSFFYQKNHVKQKNAMMTFAQYKFFGGRSGKEPGGGLSPRSWIVAFVVMFFFNGELGLRLELKGLIIIVETQLTRLQHIRKLLFSFIGTLGARNCCQPNSDAIPWDMSQCLGI